MLKRWLLALTLASLSGLTACDRVSDAEIRQLVAKTRANMVFVEGGTFMMGNPDGMVVDVLPAHKVTLSDYHIQKYEVTWAEFDLFCRATGRPLRLQHLQKKFHFSRHPQAAAAVGTWENAKAYCKWVAEVSGLPYDLPTEAQWEYAARSRGQTGAAIGRFEQDYRGVLVVERKVTRVGLHAPNPLGLYDMMGNVTELVQDWYDSEYYKKSPERDPTGPASGEEKVARGVSSLMRVYDKHTVYDRDKYEPGQILGRYVGVRCVLNESAAAQ